MEEEVDAAFEDGMGNPQVNQIAEDGASSDNDDDDDIAIIVPPVQGQPDIAVIAADNPP